MRTALSALFLIGLIAGSFSMQLAPQLALLQKSTQLDLQKSAMGKAIMGLAELHEKTGTDLTELLDALALLKDSLEAKLKSENEMYDEDSGKNTVEVARLNGLINKYQGQVDTYENELEELKTQWGNLDTQMKGLVAQNKDNTTSRDKSKTELDTATGVWSSETKDYNNAITMLGKANDELKLAKLRAKSGAAAFIQNAEHGKELQQLNEDLKTQLTIAAEGKSVFVGPIIESFVSISTSTEMMNADSIQKAIDAIDSLIKHFGQGLKTLDETYKSEKAALDKKIAHHQSIIDDLTKTLIPNKAEEMKDNTEAQTSKDLQIKESAANKKTEDGNLESQETYWTERTDLHEQMVDEFKKESDIVTQAVGILKRAST